MNFSRITWLALVVFAACNANKDNIKDHTLSMLLFDDSIIAYSGPLNKKTKHTKLSYEENEVKSFLTRHKKEHGVYLPMHIKPSSGMSSEKAMQFKLWVMEFGGFDVSWVPSDSADYTYFRIIPHLMLDTNRPKLELKMPKDEAADDFKVDQWTITAIIINEATWFVYEDTSIKEGKLMTIPEFRKLVNKKRKPAGGKLAVILKPTHSSSYQATVNALDEMTILSVKKYTVNDISTPEASFLRSMNIFEPPPPVKIETPSSVKVEDITYNDQFLIEIRSDQSIWYQVLSPVSKMAPQQVKEPVTKNLAAVIADYIQNQPEPSRKYLIKGHPDSKYPIFEKVINALKENKIYKYELITSSQ